MATPGMEIARLLGTREIAPIAMIQARVGARSLRSLFRDLKRLGYHSSFTHRGAYYTLEDIPRFDAQGLWFHGAVGFSRFGTLKETVARLVAQATAGDTQSELAALLRVRVHNPLLDLVRAGRIGREVVEGLGEFLYVSASPTEASQQVARRLDSLQASEPVALPPTETVLAILSETVRAGRVQVAPELVARRLSARGVAVSREDVERVFEHYGLLGKKNRSRPPTPSSP
jgi:hypothetical protein